MTIRTRHMRRLGAAVAALAAVGAIALPAATAEAAAGSYTPNPHQWYFDKWDIQQKVWPQTEGAGVTVALVDSGVQASLPDLQGVVVPGANMTGSGDGETDTGSNGGHGTLMAELIAGQGIGSGQFGVNAVGIAPQAKILPVTVPLNDDSDNSSTNVNSNPVAQGIKYATDHGARVINLSIGVHAASATTCNPFEQQAISYALAHNVVVVASSGDANKDPGPDDPGTCAGVLTVGGVQSSGALWANSVQGPQVSVAAPGQNVYYSDDTGQRYSIVNSGTSGASALVSAAAALIRSAYPKMPWYTVDQRLIDTAIPGNTRNNQVGYGIIDIPKALAVTKDPVPASAPNPPYQRYKAWLQSTNQAAGGSSAGGQNSNRTSSGGSILPLIIGLVFVVLILAGIVLFIVTVVRSRSRRGPGGPPNPGGGYAPAPGQYQPPGQPVQYPQGQYPPQAQSQPGPYAPPTPNYPQPPGQYPPPPGGQYPAPGQYPPHR